MHGILFLGIEKSNMQKSSLDFREIFLAVGGYMKRSF